MNKIIWATTNFFFFKKWHIVYTALIAFKWAEWYVLQDAHALQLCRWMHADVTGVLAERAPSSWGGACWQERSAHSVSLCSAVLCFHSADRHPPFKVNGHPASHLKAGFFFLTRSCWTAPRRFQQRSGDRKVNGFRKQTRVVRTRRVDGTFSGALNGV